MEVLATAIRQEKEIKGIQIEKEEVKLSLLADDMILYIEKPKDSTKMLPELTNEFGKVAGNQWLKKKRKGFYLFNFRERGKEGEREGAKLQYMVAS